MKLPREAETRSLVVAPILNRSGFDVASHPTIAALRSGYFRRIEAAIVGDAPKDFLRIYEYGEANKANPADWPAYIAKVGQKWYPNESITEHLLTRIGQRLGVRIADSRLIWVRGQLRFLSRYFLRRDESLVHGAEIFAGHLADRQFVEEVEQRDEARDVFTFQVVEESVKSRFPEHGTEIMADFVRLLGFDALVGNNDRHYFNWGVITQVMGSRAPRFAPIYDTARALFWNTTEEKLADVEAQKRVAPFLTKYVDLCMPKTGWDGLKGLNHFALVEKIARERTEFREVLRPLGAVDLAAETVELLGQEFDGLFTRRRKKFVVECLGNRVERFRAAVF